MNQSTGPLTQDELNEVLRRAQQIQDVTAQPAPDLEEYVNAAEEAGISREATLQALRERLGYPVDTPLPGNLVFARSADGHFYIGKLERVDGQKATVKFLNGSVVPVTQGDLREITLGPGQKVNYFSPSTAMWLNAPVVRVNMEAMTATVNTWGTEETVPLEKVRLLTTQIGTVARQANVWLGSVFMAVGTGVVGFLLGWLLHR